MHSASFIEGPYIDVGPFIRTASVLSDRDQSPFPSYHDGNGTVTKTFVRGLVKDWKLTDLWPRGTGKPSIYFNKLLKQGSRDALLVNKTLSPLSNYIEWAYISKISRSTENSGFVYTHCDACAYPITVGCSCNIDLHWKHTRRVARSMRSISPLRIHVPLSAPDVLSNSRFVINNIGIA